MPIFNRLLCSVPFIVPYGENKKGDEILKKSDCLDGPLFILGGGFLCL